MEREGGECVPLYEYECQDCKQKFEKLMRLGAADDEIVCPFCGSSQTKRAISLFATSSSGSSGARARDIAASCAPTGG
jgi:putative FmdB family regulatory protein